MRVFRLRTITPIYGGGARLHTPEGCNPIRAVSIAAQIRSWWRMLVAPGLDSDELRARESELFGSVHDARDGRAARSQVDVWVLNVAGTDRDDSSVDRKWAYALWPAEVRGEDEAGRKTSTWHQRWKPGLTFELHVRAPVAQLAEVERAVRAWVLFGGYGARTRRGCGALTAPGAAWLPKSAAFEDLESALALEPGALRVEVEARDIPALQRCRLAWAQQADAPQAWTTALGWLRDFRQGSGSDDWHARQFGIGKPGRSRWPEPDKLRRLGKLRDDKTIRHDATAAWPRASLGLPIVFSAIANSPSLVWRDGGAGGTTHERLASPLIVKPLPLAGGGFAALALWLHRAEPAGQVVLRDGGGGAAPFGRLLGETDSALFEPLRESRDLKAAFFKWLVHHHPDTQVQP